MFASGVGPKEMKEKTATTQPSWRLRTKVVPLPRLKEVTLGQTVALARMILASHPRLQYRRS
jgi:hypothetical protein